MGGLLNIKDQQHRAGVQQDEHDQQQNQSLPDRDSCADTPEPGGGREQEEPGEANGGSEFIIIHHAFCPAHESCGMVLGEVAPAICIAGLYSLPMRLRAIKGLELLTSITAYGFQSKPSIWHIHQGQSKSILLTGDSIIR